MAKRTFDFGDSGKFVQLDRDSDDERLQWRAADRVGDRAGEVELVIERDDGTYRNIGSVDWDTFDSMDDLYDYIEDVVDAGDADDGGYWGQWSGTVSVVSR